MAVGAYGHEYSPAAAHWGDVPLLSQPVPAALLLHGQGDCGAEETGRRHSAARPRGQTKAQRALRETLGEWRSAHSANHLVRWCTTTSVERDADRGVVVVGQDLVSANRTEEVVDLLEPGIDATVLSVG